MAEDEEKEKGFKVEDRRRFSQEGELKPEHRRADDESKHASGPVSGDDEAGSRTAGFAGEPKAAAAETGAQWDSGPSDLTFASFVVGLSTEALALLGEMPHPATGERTRDLRAAQQLIDILGILRAKTRGNLDHDEESLMDAILFDLRMKYVEIARQPAR